MTLLKAEEFFSVSDTARYRAVERRLTWRATRAAMLVIAVTAPIHFGVLGLLHPADVLFLLVINGSLCVASLVGWWSLSGPARRQPELLAFAASLGVAGAVMVLGMTGPRMLHLAIAYLMFLPPIVALVIPWRSWTEVRWLAIYAVGCTLFFAVLPRDAIGQEDRRDLVFALVVMLAAALTGHVLAARQHIRQFAQLEAISRLQRRESRQQSELQRVYHSLEISSRTDELTGCGNRLRLDEDLRTIRGRLARTGARFGLLELDIDHFKGINDTYGHLAGDEVLRRMSRALLDRARSGDEVYRFGGEEFLIILGDVSNGVSGAAERIRGLIEDLDIPNAANAPYGRLTISVGALAIGPADLGSSDGDWIARVDKALYEAKAAGRNCVVVAPPTLDATEPPVMHHRVPSRTSPARQPS